MKKIVLSDVCKTYDGKTRVVSDINATIQPGEFFVLVGPSGCGKSTILRMIAGLEAIDSGTLRIGETAANDLPPKERGISMVFQNYALYPHLTVEDNIAFGLHVKKVPKKERKKRSREVAEMLGLTPYLKRKPRQLSGGQRQRVALARAIVTRSPICLMDEPLSNLDAKLRAQMRAEIRQIQRQLGITMIFVTHDQVEAMTMGDRIMVLNRGHVQQIGKPLDIYNRPANPFVAAFIGSPPMNLADAERANHHIRADGIAPIPVTDNRLNGKETFRIGIRPEHIRIAHAGEENRTVVEVKHVEVLGNETILAFDVGGNEWKAKWTGQWNLHIGEKVPILIDYDRICAFDSENGALIKAPDRTEVHAVDREVIV